MAEMSREECIKLMRFMLELEKSSFAEETPHTKMQHIIAGYTLARNFIRNELLSDKYDEYLDSFNKCREKHRE